jgi:hypothetical protein
MRAVLVKGNEKTCNFCEEDCEITLVEAIKGETTAF